jgi:glycosyltransferase involved in cell wall biosynthesis
VRVQYITYDGLTSLIGQSQVWPYLKGLSAAGHQFDVISFEHRERLERIGDAVARDVAASAINWHPCTFRSRPPILAKLLDQREMIGTAGRLAASGRVDAVHARSYVAADAALKLKRRFGLPFIFDMRGFWVDERRDGGRWRQSNPLYRQIYRRWKIRERALTAESDHIVVLTKAAKSVVEGWDDYRGQPVTVIPCCIDHSAFGLRAPGPRKAARETLDIGDAATVLVYLGSVGTNYLLGDMLRFFSRLRRARPGAKFLFIGWLAREEVLAAANALGIEIDAEDIIIQPSEHGEVPFWLATADIAIGLRQPSFSSLGASPTKLAEYLACGLPVVVNDGVGDVGAIVEQLGAGAVLSTMSDDEMDGVVSRLDDILAIDPADLRERSRKIHDMPVALEKYQQVYDSIAASNPERVA